MIQKTIHVSLIDSDKKCEFNPDHYVAQTLIYQYVAAAALLMIFGFGLGFKRLIQPVNSDYLEFLKMVAAFGGISLIVPALFDSFFAKILFPLRFLARILAPLSLIFLIFIRLFLVWVFTNVLNKHLHERPWDIPCITIVTYIVFAIIFVCLIPCIRHVKILIKSYHVQDTKSPSNPNNIL